MWGLNSCVATGVRRDKCWWLEGRGVQGCRLRDRRFAGCRDAGLGAGWRVEDQSWAAG